MLRLAWNITGDLLATVPTPPGGGTASGDRNDAWTRGGRESFWGLCCGCHLSPLCPCGCLLLWHKPAHPIPRGLESGARAEVFHTSLHRGRRLSGYCGAEWLRASALDSGGLNQALPTSRSRTQLGRWHNPGEPGLLTVNREKAGVGPPATGQTKGCRSVRTAPCGAQ